MIKAILWLIFGLLILIATAFIGHTKTDGWQIVSIGRPITAILFIATIIAGLLNK